MADDPSANIRTFTHHCFNGICHCDWRITLQDCEESTAMYYVNIINIIVSALCAILGIGLLIHRVGMKGHTIWSPAGVGNGILRPKPVDCSLIFFVLFGILRMITSLVLVTNVGAGNLLGRSVLYELPWSIGLGGITIYLLGVSQAIAQSNSTSGWLPSPAVMDIAGFMTMILPALVGISMTIAAGVMIDKDSYTAELLIRINYGIWFLWTGGVGNAVFFAGVRLVRILKSHHRKLRQGSNDAAVKAGIMKIQVAIAGFAICLWIFALVLLLYGSLRDLIMRNTVGSIFLGVGWSLTASITVLVMELSIIFSPNTSKNAALRSKKSTEGSTGIDSSSMYSTQPDREIGAGSTMGAFTATFQNDDEAIMNALKENSQTVSQGFSPKGFRQSIKQSKNNFFSFSGRHSKRRLSNASSQMELTSHDLR
ncbi:hypothetical protein BDA99DRAFT_528255 [Phascolomyces articulosus]|uniref:Uncharacterized protein n=1 Tax=Phascolomyces articulosus TaxID=60185 RepID=A0AAD5JXA6_9FUNG|nr:hypothetical protein BDA99DRAFT_528255 [Phascolomyces articulosus]